MSRPRPSLASSLGILAAFSVRQVSWSRKTVFMLVLLLVPAGLATLIRAEAPPGTAEVFRRNVLPNLHLFLIQLFSLFYGASLVRDAIEDRTLTFLLTRPIGRQRVVFGLWLGMLVFVVPATLVSTLTSWYATSAGTRVDAPGLDRLLVALLVGTVFYALLFLFLGLVFKRPTILGLLFIIVVEGVLGSIPGPVRRIAPSTYIEALLGPTFGTRTTAGAELEEAAREVGTIAGPAPLTSTTAAAVLVGIFALLLIVLVRVVRRKDFVVTQKDG